MKKIPLFKLEAIPQTEESKKLPKFKSAGNDWAGNAIGTRHQLGGEPLNIQKNEYPICPDCKQKMSFYAQLDSINDDIIIADCGLIAVFICLTCLEVFAEVISS